MNSLLVQSKYKEIEYIQKQIWNVQIEHLMCLAIFLRMLIQPPTELTKSDQSRLMRVFNCTYIYTRYE